VGVPHIDPADASQEAIATYDKNGDGRLSREELAACPGILQHLSTYDTDGDGSVSASEVESEIRRLRTGGVGLTKLSITVRYNNRPLEGATVKIVPEEYLGGEVLAATGVTNPRGIAVMDLPDDVSPASDRGLLGVNINPDGQLFDWPTGPRWFRYMSLPLARLAINGVEHESTTCRWRPHEAVRRRMVDGLEVETIVRMLPEQPGLLYRVRVENPTATEQTARIAVTLPGSIDGEGTDAVIAYESDDPKLETSHGFGDVTSQLYGEKPPTLQMAHALVDAPDETKAEEKRVVAAWSRKVPTGGAFEVRFVMAHGRSSSAFPAPEVLANARDSRANFDARWRRVKDVWAQRWADMFTPGNKHFSGHLPILVTGDARLADIYYRSVLTLLVLHRTNMKMCDRVFVTSGERDKGVVFFWDTSMWARTFALLEPKGAKTHAKLFLGCDPHRGPVYSMDLGKQWDGWYAANDSTIFTFVIEYLNVTGDLAFLDEKVGDLTTLGHLDKLATNWRKLRKDESVMLADYGENQNLLECAPAYVHRVPSFNAANVWMMRHVATLHEERGDTQRAAELRGWADEIAAAVRLMYKEGDGVWYALHRDGKRVELRHCYDFVCIGKFMRDDLTPKMKGEMVDFVERELVTDKWMRAMSPRDEAAAISDRPDHGPMGAYDAWPALTAESMCFLDAWRPAVEFLDSTQAVLYEGIYGQSREYYGERRAEHDAPVRIAMRGACMRESVGGGAFAEMIISTLFGFSPTAGQELKLVAPDTPRGFTGELRNVRYGERLVDIVSSDSGVAIRPQP
jgi:hypothetical protein